MRSDIAGDATRRTHRGEVHGTRPRPRRGGGHGHHALDDRKLVGEATHRSMAGIIVRLPDEIVVPALAPGTPLPSVVGPAVRHRRRWQARLARLGRSRAHSTGCTTRSSCSPSMTDPPVGGWTTSSAPGAQPVASARAARRRHGTSSMPASVSSRWAPALVLDHVRDVTTIAKAFPGQDREWSQGAREPWSPKLGTKPVEEEQDG